MRNKHLNDEYLSIWLFFSLMVIYALVYMTKNCYSAAMVALTREGVLTKTQTGAISAMFYIIYAPFQIVGGFAADKYPPHKLILIGLVGATIANALIVANTNYYFMMTVWTLNGAVQFGVWPSVFKMASQMLSPVHRLKGVFYITLASSFGIVLSYLLAGAVSGWKSNFVVSSVVLAVCSVYWFFASDFFDKKMVDEDSNYHGVAHMPVAKTEEKSNESVMWLLIKSGLIFMLPVAVFQTVLSTGVQSLTPNMMAENYKGISASLASILTVIPVVMGVTGKMLMKSIFEKMNHSECSVMAVSVLFSIAPLTLMLLVGKISATLIVVVISLVTLISNASYLMVNPYMTVHFARMGRSATMSGILNAMASLGIVVANLVSTSIADRLGWIATIVCWIGFACISLVLILITYRPWKKFIKLGM